MRASDDEVEALRATARSFLTGALPPARVRAVLEAGGGYDRDAWHTLTRDLSLTGIAIPEEFGGAGYTFGELGVVLQEFGATLAPVPFLPTAVAACAVLALGDLPARRALLPELAAGDTVATAVLTGAALRAEERGGAWFVSGNAPHVPDGVHAHLAVVRADTEAGGELLAVRLDAGGVTVRPLTALDPLRPIAAVDFDGAPATLLGRGSITRPWLGLELAVSAQLVAVACEQVGGAARCLDMIVDYLKTREQFGVPIGSFQALKHRCADMLTSLEAARSIADDACERVAAAFAGDGLATLHATAAAAAAWCADTYVHLAQENVQLHGGIGFTWEHDAHLHLRRARADQLLYGTPREQRRVVAAAMGI